jgi:hypothetical protein
VPQRKRKRKDRVNKRNRKIHPQLSPQLSPPTFTPNHHRKPLFLPVPPCSPPYLIDTARALATAAGGVFPTQPCAVPDGRRDRCTGGGSFDSNFVIQSRTGIRTGQHRHIPFLIGSSSACTNKPTKQQSNKATPT